MSPVSVAQEVESPRSRRLAVRFPCRCWDESGVLRQEDGSTLAVTLHTQVELSDQRLLSTR